MNALARFTDADRPFISAFFAGEAFVSGIHFVRSWAFVVEILSLCASAQIGLSVVQAVAVYMVNDKAFRSAGNLAVHCDYIGTIRSKGVEVVFSSATVPFVFGQAFIIIGVDNREFALR